MIRTQSTWTVGISLLLVTACGSGNGGDDVMDSGQVDAADIIVLDDGADLSNQPDTPQDDVTDTGTDTGPSYQNPIPAITDPLPLRVGVAEVTMPVPVGINTAGYGATSGAKTPFVEDFLGTDSIWMHPDFKIVFLEGGMGRLILIRSDTVGFASPVWTALVQRLEARTGLDFSNELIVGGTHTHSGPGRLIVGAMEVLADKFFPQFFDRLTNTLTDTIVEAYEDLEPARFGYTIAHDSKMHHDRRCNNPDLEEPDLPLLRFDDLEGKTKALVMTYAVHGTVLSSGMHHLSQDVYGGVERKVQEMFDYHVPVIMFNSWGGDMSPGDPLAPTVQGPHSDIHGSYTKCEGIGNRAVQTVSAVFDDIVMKDQADISSITLWAPMNREALGYEDGEFPYEWGAVYCGGGGDGNCWDGEPDPIPDLDKACLFFPEELPAPDRTLFTVGRIGDLFFTTFPGEAVTQIGIDLRDAISVEAGGLDVAFIGYSQDYIGYATPEWDFYQGGYEAAGAIWGPKQGDYLTARILETAKKFLDPEYELSWDMPDPATPPSTDDVDPWVPTESDEPGAVMTQVAPNYGITDTVIFQVSGGDPWLVAPRAFLEIKDGENFIPFKRNNGTQVDSYGYEFSLYLDPQPGYFDDPDAASRTFAWEFRMPITRVADQVSPITPGTYRLTVKGPYADDDGEIKDFQTTSDSFEIAED